MSQATSLNKEKLQASMQKNAITTQRKLTNIESLKEKIMNPHPTTQAKIPPDQPKSTYGENSSNSNRQIISTAELFTVQKPNLTQPSIPKDTQIKQSYL